MQNEPTFAELFKKYRLRAQITTLAEFANLLAEEGMVYENSLFSRWQSGDRTPKDRKTLLSVIRVFAKQGGIRNQQQANELLQSASQYPLTQLEQEDFESNTSTTKSSSNELVEYEKVAAQIPNEAIDLLALTVSAMNHTIANRSEARLLSKIAVFAERLHKIKLTRSTSFLIAFYIPLLIWCISLNLDGSKTTMSNALYGLTYAFLPVIAGVFGINSAYKWGGIKSSMGKALFYLSFGLITWGFGNIVWAFYVIALHVDVPYPSFADALYMVSWPLWGIGIYHISKAAGITFQIRKKSTIIQIVALPILMIAFSFYLIINVARSSILLDNGDIFKAFFDLGYPFLDAVLVAEIFLMFGLTFKQVQKRYRAPLIVLMLGILTNYVADFVFSYTTTKGMFFDGSYYDMLFPSAMLLIGIATNSFEEN